MRRDPLAAVAEYHARAAKAGNAWAQTLARKTTYGLTPGEPNRREAPMQSETDAGQLATWTPEPGEECLHHRWGGAVRRVRVHRLEERFALILDGDEGEWVMVADLRPLVGA